MWKTNHQRYLRNPLFIIVSFIVLLLPEFAFLCAVDLPFNTFWSDFTGCSQEFVFQSFIGKSIWSLILVITVFETFLKSQHFLQLTVLPDKPVDWLLFQGRLFGSLIASFIIYMTLTYFLEWVVTERISFMVGETDLLSNFKKIVFIGFLAININVILQLYNFRNHPLSGRISVLDNIGERSIALKEVKWFEKKGRNYFAYTGDREFKINSNLRILEKKLSQNQFVRINRAVIANISAIQDYSYWENEKYILRLHNDMEFVVARKRMLDLKAKLVNRKDLEI